MKRSAPQARKRPSNSPKSTPSISSDSPRGSDIGEKGELEGEAETNGAEGKRSGRYSAIIQKLQLKYSISNDLRIAPTINLSRHDISGVATFDDRHQFAFQGGGMEIRYRLLSRESSPFGLTLSVDPTWHLRDGAAGEPVRQYAAPMLALFDKEIIKDRIFAAFNLLYEPRWTRIDATGTSQNNSTAGLGGAITNRIAANLFLGAELRYLRAYDGATLNQFAGHGLFLGPTLYWVLTDRANLTLAWNAQVAGKAVDAAGALDLENFERHQFRVRFGYTF